MEPEITPDGPFGVVFRRGETRTHVAYNAGPVPAQVRFSDGVAVDVEPGRTAVARGEAKAAPASN